MTRRISSRRVVAILVIVIGIGVTGVFVGEVLWERHCLSEIFRRCRTGRALERRRAMRDLVELRSSRAIPDLVKLARGNPDDAAWIADFIHRLLPLDGPTPVALTESLLEWARDELGDRPASPVAYPESGEFAAGLGVHALPAVRALLLERASPSVVFGIVASIIPFPDEALNLVAECLVGGSLVNRKAALSIVERRTSIAASFEAELRVLERTDPLLRERVARLLQMLRLMESTRDDA